MAKKLSAKPIEIPPVSKTIFWNIRGFSYHKALIVVVIIWFIQPIALIFSNEFVLWLLGKDGIPGWLAGLISTSLSVYFRFKLERQSLEFADTIKFKPLKKEINDAIHRIVQSRKELMICGPLGIIGDLILVYFWYVHIVPFTSIIWLVGGIFGIFTTVLFGISFVIFAFRVAWAVIRAKAVSDSLNPFRGEMRFHLRLLSAILSRALALPILAAASWLYAFLFIPSFHLDQKFLVVLISLSLVGYTIYSYLAFVIRMRKYMTSARDKLLDSLEHEWAKLLRKGIRVEKSFTISDRTRVEILKMYVDELNKWPFDINGLIRITNSIIVGLLPFLIEYVMRLSNS